MRYGSFTSNTFLYIFVALLFLSGCKKDEVDCEKYIQSEYGEYERVKIVDKEVFYIFTERDTTIFSYTGYDTLLFEVLDSTQAAIDTLKFTGMGKNIWFNQIGYHELGGNSGGCSVPRYEETLDITFIPQDTSYDKLTFNLTAKLGTARLVYNFLGHSMSALTTDINRQVLSGYMSSFQIRNKMYYRVTYYYAEETPSGRMEYYLNSQHALFLFVLNREKWFLKIN